MHYLEAWTFTSPGITDFESISKLQAEYETSVGTQYVWGYSGPKDAFAGSPSPGSTGSFQHVIAYLLGPTDDCNKLRVFRFQPWPYAYKLHILDLLVKGPNDPFNGISLVFFKSQTTAWPYQMASSDNKIIIFHIHANLKCSSANKIYLWDQAIISEDIEIDLFGRLLAGSGDATIRDLHTVKGFEPDSTTTNYVSAIYIATTNQIYQDINSSFDGYASTLDTSINVVKPNSGKNVAALQLIIIGNGVGDYDGGFMTFSTAATTL